jgi:hypothetical protein
MVNSIQFNCKGDAPIMLETINKPHWVAPSVQTSVKAPTSFLVTPFENNKRFCQFVVAVVKSPDYYQLCLLLDIDYDA